MTLIIRTLQLFKHPPFSKKNEEFEHPHLKFLF